METRSLYQIKGREENIIQLLENIPEPLNKLWSVYINDSSINHSYDCTKLNGCYQYYSIRIAKLPDPKSVDGKEFNYYLYLLGSPDDSLSENDTQTFKVLCDLFIQDFSNFAKALSITFEEVDYPNKYFDTQMW